MAKHPLLTCLRSSAGLAFDSFHAYFFKSLLTCQVCPSRNKDNKIYFLPIPQYYFETDVGKGMKT
jgi:hypothetical protein